MTSSVDRCSLKARKLANSVDRCSAAAHGEHWVLGGLSMAGVHWMFEAQGSE